MIAYNAKRSTILLGLLTCGYGLAFIDRLLISVVAEPVKIEFGLSDKQLFLLTGLAFVFVYGACGILAGWLLDRFNRSTIVAWGIGIWSLFTAACGVTQNFPQLAIARAGVGTGESVIVPAAMSLISETYPPERRPMAMGIFYAGGMVGVFLAWALGGWISAHYGWRAAFYIAGPPGFVLALVIGWMRLDAPREKIGTGQRSPSSSTFRELANNAPYVWLTAASSLLTFVSIGLVSMLGSLFVRSHGMSIGEVGLIFGPVMAIGMAFGQVGGGWLGNRLAQRGVRTLIAFTAWISFALFPIYLVLLFAPSRSIALAAMFLGALTSTFYSPSHSASYMAVCAPHTRATAAGVHGFMNSLIGGGVTPFLVGALSDHWRPQYGADSLKYAMMVGLVTFLLAGVLFLCALRSVPPEAARPSTSPPV